MRQKGQKSNIKLNIFIPLVALIIIFALVTSICDISGAWGGNSVITVQIPEGATMAGVARILKENGVISYPLLFRMYMKKGEYSDVVIQMGQHTLSENMSYSEIISQICNVSAFGDEVKILVPEGEEVRQIIERVVSSGLATKSEFLEALGQDYDYKFLEGIPSSVKYRLEGFLFPATYTFTKGASATEIVDAMLKKFDYEFKDEYYARCDELGISVYEAITLATVVEREAAGDEDRELVASVFWNRLRSTDLKRLQSDATVQYIFDERKPALSYADIAIDSPYNTYYYEGLPLGPIASPGLASIKAALYPPESNYYYFQVGPQGNHVFSRTFDEHNAVWQ